jgi:class 3 adenylate cyclase
MDMTGLRRKLTAILSADVKGYSRLMGEDETGTIRTLTVYREVIANSVESHGGRVIDSPGDNLLAEFGSIVQAVESAVEIQRALQEKNQERPESGRMEFRIGINIGDVVVEGDRLYGDGVNVAARLEALAEGGGICISSEAYRQVEGKLPLAYRDMGERQLKNFARPVRVYSIEVDSDNGTHPGSTTDSPSTQPEIHFCTASDGVRIAYATAGQGPPLVRQPTG